MQSDTVQDISYNSVTYKASFKRILQHNLFPIALIIVLSTLVNFVLVFGFSEYKHYLTSDMHGYWERAVQIFDGDEKSPNTWVSNAPFYPRVIARIFTWLNFFHLNNYRLEVLLSLNILSSALGTYALYRIGMHIMGSNRASLLLAGGYAFSYPSLYFNTFLLGEPMAVPLIITAIWLVFKYQHSYKIAYAGLLLGFAVGIRPSNGPLGLPLALYIFLMGLPLRHLLRSNFREWIRELFPRAVKAGVFSVSFFLVILGILAENYRISNGELRGITAHSGYNFFLGQTQAHAIISRWDGIGYGFVPSSVAGNPEFGTVEVGIPIYKSDQFVEEGKKMLEHHPELWIEHLGKYKFLFFDNLFPAVPSVLGFSYLFDPFRYIIFSMFVLCGLIFIPLREKDVRYADVALFSSIFVICSLSLYFFTVTHQYFFNFSYTIYVLFAMTAFGVFRHFRKYKKVVIGYVIFLLLATLSFQLYKVFHGRLVEKKIDVVVTQNQHPIFRLDQIRVPVEEETESFAVDTLNFLQQLKLTHATIGKKDFTENFFLEATTIMEVKNDGRYMFTVYADDGYSLEIDGRRIVGFNGLKKMNEFDKRETIFLEKGTYTLKASLFQAGVFSGLVGYYRRVDNEIPFAPWYYDTLKGQGHLIGVDSEDVVFHLPSKLADKK